VWKYRLLPHSSLKINGVFVRESICDLVGRGVKPFDYVFSFAVCGQHENAGGFVVLCTY